MGRLVSAAATLGVTIVEGRPLRGRPGHYDDETRTIVLRPGLPRRRRRGVLGHELGHAYYKHIRCGDPYLSARQERQADEYARAPSDHPRGVRARPNRFTVRTST
ncbi:ImmA/IrrE family metallo-endopeptidase [Rhodococcus zopfii]|uniref:ImmA/IrrE family metallo-endopeptidase n=1 Tax=Rhodococcus zopfii TaxID=43772 RepID=A0ABU3WTR7_9NOCA|nr:ImmA/IrrE family metallo-endopeptidase [Rhodococcus zopfii]